MAAGSLQDERQALADARRRWGEHASPAGVASWFAGNAEVEYLAGCYGAALKDAGYARRVASDLATTARSLRVIGCVQLERGQTEAALRSLEESLAAARTGLAAADLAFALAESGRLQEALEAARSAADEPSGWARGRATRALLRAGELGSPPGDEGGEGFGWIQLGLAAAETYGAGGQPALALDLAEALIGRLRQAGVRAQLGDALLVRVRALGDLGRQAQQAAAAKEVRELALCLGSGRLLALLG
jgi:tetratricopeptide (TPR) repeat protein